MLNSAHWPVAFVICCLVPLCAQTTVSDQSPMHVIQVTTNNVVVDVVVTKGSGEPVLALHKEDFKVLEDGKPQTIDFFEEHTAGTLPPGAPPLPKMPPDVYTNVPPAPESDAVNVILIDTLNTDTRDQVYVHKQMLEFLGNMPAGTRAAIFILGSKLRFVQGFTTDTAVLRAALEDKKNGFLAQRDSTWRSREDNADDQRETDTMSMMLTSADGIAAVRESQADYTSFQYGERVSMTLKALNYLARYLAGVPGRKNLIWFASSFPVTIFPAPTQGPATSQARAYISTVKQTADLLTDAKIAVYPISAEGMVVAHNMEADSANRGRWGASGTSWEETVDHANTIAAMEQLAADTGGKAFYNTNDLSNALSRAISDGSHYYTVVYTPTNKNMDGKYRRIEVKLTADKHKLAYRHGYNADASASVEAQPNRDPLRSLLIRGLPSATQFLYKVRAAPASPQPEPNAARAGENSALSGRVTRYSIDFMFPWASVKLDHVFPATDQKNDPIEHGVWHGKMSIGAVAYDRDGKAVNWISSTPEISLQPEVYAKIQKAGMKAHIEIDLPNTDVHLETGIYDWGSGKAGTLEIPLHASVATATSAPQAVLKTK